MKNCLIVGGGLIGMLTAKELVDSGVNVTIIDKGAVAKESSWAGGGILSPLYPWRYDDAITKLAQWSQHYYPGLCEQLRHETTIDPEYTDSGLLMLEVDDKHMAHEWAKRFDHQMEDVLATDLKLQEVELRSGHWSNCLCLPKVAQIRNPRLLGALRTWLANKGVTFVEHTPVTSVWAENSKVFGVWLGRQNLESESVIIAGGAWSSSLLSTVGLSVEIFPVQGQMVLFKAVPGLIKHIIMHEGFYIIPRCDGHVLAGSTVEYRGFDKQTTREAYEKLHAAAISLVPKLADYPVVKHWAGLRPGSTKGIPYIGPVPDFQGLYVNSGHFRNGVVMGPASARLMVDMVLKRDTILDARPYQFVN